MKEQTFFRDYDCPILGGVAVVKLVRRSFTPDEATEPIVSRADFGGCENVWDCGVVAKGSRFGNASFDWPKCAAFQMMNSSGKV